MEDISGIITSVSTCNYIFNDFFCCYWKIRITEKRDDREKLSSSSGSISSMTKLGHRIHFKKETIDGTFPSVSPLSLPFYLSNKNEIQTY